MEMIFSWSLEYWHWLILGLVLFGVELLFSGAYFLWIGAAALLVAGISFVFPLSAAVQAILFAVFSIILMVISRKLLPRGWLQMKENSLNQRQTQLIGLRIILDQPIYQGKAQVQIGDSKWLVHGPDMAVGETAVVIKVDGVILIVEPLHILK